MPPRRFADYAYFAMSLRAIDDAAARYAGAAAAFFRALILRRHV